VLDPAELYRLDPDGPQLEEPVLVMVLDGFVDAGNAARLAVESLLAAGDARTVARFDVDQLVDYRSRRPPLRFATDRWDGYDAPELDVVALTDTAGASYLLLTGPEPDMQWERFAAAVAQLVERLGVRLTVNLTGIPMAVPHTRPIGVTVHGTRPELTEGHDALFADAEVPGSAIALTEIRPGEAGHAAMGFAVHVPHYLARAEYPQAARVLVDHLGLATGLYLSTAALTEAGERADREIAEQVAGSDEVAQVVSALERQYDAVVTGGAERAAAGLGGPLPSADELGAEVERFLADTAGPDDGGGEPDDPGRPDGAAPPDR
jgi:hypothetical protein